MKAVVRFSTIGDFQILTPGLTERQTALVTELVREYDNALDGITAPSYLRNEVWWCSYGMDDCVTFVRYTHPEH